MASPYTHNEVYTWNKVHLDAKELAAKLLPYSFTKILAVTRGGLFPASIIARELGIHYVDTICISSYVDQVKTKDIKIIKPALNMKEKYLVIEDMTDSGDTLALIRKLLPDSHIAVLYAKPKGRQYVDTFISEVEQDAWILFPWDSELSFIEPISNKY